MINIQAFVFNVFGSIDNLAWIWVQEKSLAKEDGSAIPSAWVGLRSISIHPVFFTVDRAERGGSSAGTLRGAAVGHGAAHWTGTKPGAAGSLREHCNRNTAGAPSRTFLHEPGY
jgi:hypothetical protein